MAFTMDNAAMIALAGYHKYLRKETIKNPTDLDRNPSLILGE
jgi:tRNA A37 threonylcarbamoyltransferase TsaD